MRPRIREQGSPSEETPAEDPASTGYFVIGLCLLLIVCGLFALGVFPNPFSGG